MILVFHISTCSICMFVFVQYSNVVYLSFYFFICNIQINIFEISFVKPFIKFGATESLISWIRGCDWILFSPDKKYSPSCHLVLRISYLPQKYFFEKRFLNFSSIIFLEAGNDNFIPYDSCSSAVIDRSKSRNEQKFFHTRLFLSVFV